MIVIELCDMTLKYNNTAAAVDKAASKDVQPAAVDKAASKDVQPEECIVCFEPNKSHAFIPCGHLCVCAKCAEEHYSAADIVCPMCRDKATGIYRVFL